MQEPVEIRLDTIQLKNTLDELRAFAKVSKVFSQLIQLFLDSIGDGELFDIEPEAAIRAGHFAVILKPSDKLFELLTTLRAGQPNFVLSDLK